MAMRKKPYDQSMAADLAASAAKFNGRVIERYSRRKRR